MSAGEDARMTTASRFQAECGCELQNDYAIILNGMLR